MIPIHILADATAVIGAILVYGCLMRLSAGPRNPNSTDRPMYTREQREEYIYQEDGRPLMRRGTEVQ